MRIDQDRALAILEDVVEAAEEISGSEDWEKKVNHLSYSCGGHNLTFIAMLGTALLAKATDSRADPFALKSGLSTPGAYSARSLCQHVLAAHAPRLELDLGVTGREPLNNQPFFAKDRVSSNLPVHRRGKPAFRVLLDCLQQISEFETEAEARAALGGFVRARKKTKTLFSVAEDTGDEMKQEKLLAAIVEFTSIDSEHGKRAQAVAAGLLDVLSAGSRVMLDKIHDPDRHMPGDVGVRSESTPWGLERVFEVRDKPVPETDLYHVTQKAAERGVGRVGVIAVSAAQERIDVATVKKWAAEKGVILTVFVGWEQFLREVIFWSPQDPSKIVGRAYRAVLARAQEVEVSGAGISFWIEAGRSRSGTT